MSFTKKDTSSYTYFCFWAWHSLATAYFVLLLLSLLPLFGQNYQNKKVLPIFRSLVSSWYLQIFWQICQYCKYSKIGTQNISLYFVKKYIYWPCAMYMCIWSDFMRTHIDKIICHLNIEGKKWQIIKSICVLMKSDHMQATQKLVGS